MRQDKKVMINKFIYGYDNLRVKEYYFNTTNKKLRNYINKYITTYLYKVVRIAYKNTEQLKLIKLVKYRVDYKEYLYIYAKQLIKDGIDNELKIKICVTDLKKVNSYGYKENRQQKTRNKWKQKTKESKNFNRTKQKDFRQFTGERKRYGK